MRSTASTSGSILARLRDGTQVEVLSQLDNGWVQVSHAGKTGYVSGEYLLISEEQPAPEQPEQQPAPVEPAPAEGPVQEESGIQYARVTASVLNVRSGPATGYDKVGRLKAGAVVEILGENDGWYQISSGYISAEYVVLTDAASVSKGQEIADFALGYIGYPYVYGSASPSKGFDCSGFVKYIYSQFGYTINRTASSQLDNGTAVDRSELQPGDLVFFKKAGTGSKRASHVGIYIGDSQFVHASTSKVGVIVSHLSDAYYTTGFVGARRII